MLKPADAAFAERLSARLTPGAVGPAEPRYLQDPRGRVTGQAGFVARPRDTEEVAAIVRACGEARVGTVPYGGGTGLVLGQIAGEGPVPLILSLERMARVREILPGENVLVVEAGAILADVHRAAGEAGRLFPLTLASQGSARIGGLLSTNAGGTGVLRHGNARDLVLGIEAVLPDGSVMHGLRRLRKDNTGYDLRHLLIGAEGTLGVITAASLRLVPKPAAEGTAMFQVASPQAALDLLALAGERMGGCVSAFELIHRAGTEFLAETMPDYRPPWPDPPEWVVLIDTGMPAGLDPVRSLEELFEAAVAAGQLADGLVAQSEAQRAALWEFRERIPEANRRIGSVSSHDIALPLGEVPEFIARAPGEVAKLGEFRINVFGHLGDGNLHWNVFPPKGVPAAALRGRADEVKQVVHDLVHAMGGSMSAEHGIGRLKVDDLERYGDPAKLAAMRAVKRALDPLGIMNPGAVLRGYD
ncbi:MAG: FAD-binding oxidoreductase [Paracoccaceae bacterium]